MHRDGRNKPWWPEQPTDCGVELSRGHQTEDVMRHLCTAIVTSAALLAAGASPHHAKAQGVTPLPPDYEPPPNYGPPPPGYEPLPYAFGSPPGYGPHPEYGPPPPGYFLPHHAYWPPPGYGPTPNHRPSPTGYGTLPYTYRPTT